MADETYGIALGMIETRGLISAIEAADAVTKASEVRLISRGRRLCQHVGARRNGGGQCGRAGEGRCLRAGR